MTIIQRSLGRLSATTLVALLLTVLLAPGCTKERPSVADPTETSRSYTTDDWEGSTYMSIALRTTPPTDPTSEGQVEDDKKKEGKTGQEDFTTWQGDDEIENFAVYIVSEGINTVQCIAGPVTDTDLATWDATKQELRLKPFATAPVSKRIFAFFNIPTQYQKYLNEKLGNREEFLDRIAEPIPYRGEQGITYSSGDAPILDAFRPDSHIAKKVITKDVLPKMASMTKDGRNADLINPWQVVDFPNRFCDRYSEIMKAASITFHKRKDRIMASGERYNYLPEDYITKDEVEHDNRNLVQVYTRRVLAQAVVTAGASLVERPNFAGLGDMKGMKLVGLSFQVLNFEPTFFPIAKTTKEGEWPGNSNTVTPLYDKSDNSSRINLSTYTSTYDNDEKFEVETLTADRYFRSAHFVYDLPSIKELKQDDPDYAQKLLREREVTSDKKADGTFYDDVVAPKHTTTFWGSCYVTESTQRWGTDSQSGYTTANTPFFALVAAFDTESLPWGDNTKTTAQAKINNMQQDLEDALKGWRKELAEKEERLKELEKKNGGSAGGDAWAPADATFKEWCETVARAFAYPEDKRTIEYYPVDQEFKGWYVHFEEIKHMRQIYRSGQDETLNNYTQFYDCIAGKESTKNNPKPTRWLSTFERTLYSRQLIIRSSDSPSDKQFKNKAKERLPLLWKQLQEQDKERESNPDSAEMDQLRKDIQTLKKKIKDFETEYKSSGDKYPKDTNTGHNLEFYTQFIYEQGITRIFYSQVDKKFYLNYHEIDLANRDGKRHTLSVDQPWLDDLKRKLPNGKDFPTEANGAPATAAVLPPTPELMQKLSDLLNRKITETDLNTEERHSMDFYLYGRVAPGLVQYFGGAKRIDRIDLQSGYVAWYTAQPQNKDQVVSYPCYIREKNVDEYGREKKASIQKARLMMVYYAWVNPNTGDPTNCYASPILRNNIYHMHVTGFSQVGLSAIPFVPRIKEGNGYKFLHTPFDPDEVVPENAPLVNANGTGQPAGITAGSSSYRITF